ncbi:hypothetical protein RSAG8_06559, partial [Rhizoctonia solani AG-8 WAC10335]
MRPDCQQNLKQYPGWFAPRKRLPNIKLQHHRLALDHRPTSIFTLSHRVAASPVSTLMAADFISNN